MLCGISGVVPQEPVVCVPSGRVYERRLASAHIQLTGTEPTTGAPVTMDDLLVLQGSTLATPRPTSANSVPGLLATLGSEWDSVAIESHALRGGLEAARQELSQALYQHDAACRVIARLLREREQLRAALSSAQAALASRPSGGSVVVSEEAADAPGTALPADALAAISDKCKELTKPRRKRAVPAGTVDAMAVGSLRLTRALTPHSPSAPGITALATLPEGGGGRPEVLLTGGADRALLLLDAQDGAVRARMDGASARGAVTGAAMHSSRDVLYSAGTDGSLRVWANVSVPAVADGPAAGGSYRAAHVLRPHAAAAAAGGGIVALAAHPVDDLLVSVGRDGSWAVSDAAAGRVLAVLADASLAAAGGATAGGLHPDGTLLAVAGAGGAVTIFDVRESKAAATLPPQDGAGGGGSVRAVAFSENGWTMATGGDGGAVHIWDLRKVAQERELPPALTATAPVAVTALAFDFSAHFLASGTADGGLRLWHTKEAFSPISSHADASGAITGLCWVRGARTLYASSMDRAVRVYGE